MGKNHNWDDEDEAIPLTKKAPKPQDRANNNINDVYDYSHRHIKTHVSKSKTKVTNEIQSHNYEPDESQVWREHIAKLHNDDNNNNDHFYYKNNNNSNEFWTTDRKRSCKRWIITFIIGVIQATIAIVCNYYTRALCKYKYELVYDLLNPNEEIFISSNKEIHWMEYDDNVIIDNSTQWQQQQQQMLDLSSSSATNWNNIGSAFVAFVGLQIIFAAIASMFVWIEPISGGSGIPEIKCFLNGIDLPRIVHVKTVFCKVIGVTFSVAAGLPVGKEGPMVHSGAVVAVATSQSKMFSFLTKDFHNDMEKRDFVACGAAAGVASAFVAPIGGVLFSLEEGASYWSTKLTWRAFFCAMSAIATLYAMSNVDVAWGQADIDKLFSFGEFSTFRGEPFIDEIKIWELPVFICIGCLGGLIGAIFNATNEHITKWRMKHVNHSKGRRFTEVCCVSLLVSIVSFLMPLLWGHCTELPKDRQHWTNQKQALVESLIPFTCKPGREYNEVASLMFTEADVAIKQLFHLSDEYQDDMTTSTPTFSPGALALFFISYILLATVTYGIAIPSGLFVPSLLSGAALGRLFGYLLHKLFPNTAAFSDPGTYALMGAAAVLGGMARMTISLTIILLEATGNMQYVLSLMIILMSARFTGNLFNEGLYDIHIHLKKIHFLEADVPSIAEKREIDAAHAMSTNIKCLRPVERVGVVYNLLQSCSHNTFPIVDDATGGTLYGTISRSVLVTLLHYRAFGPPPPSDSEPSSSSPNDFGPERLSPLITWETIEQVYPNYPTIEDVPILNKHDHQWLLDLRPYANTTPYTINSTASIQRTYRLFRTLGLRFLCVVNHQNQVVGVITREDLLPDSLDNSIMSSASSSSSAATHKNINAFSSNHIT